MSLRQQPACLRRLFVLFSLVFFLTITLSQAQVLYVGCNYGQIDTISTGGTVNTFATGLSWTPSGIVTDSSGDIYVSESFGESTIYKFTSAGVESVFASGLNSPDGLAFDSSGNLYEADNGSDTINKITPGGVVSTFATGFSNPYGLAFDSSGNLYEADGYAGKIFKITSSGTVSTFVTGLSGPSYLTFDSSGNLYVTCAGSYSAGTAYIAKITPGGSISTFATGFSSSLGITFDSMNDDLYYTERNGNVDQFTLSGTETLFATISDPESITFEPEVVPEPSSWALLIVGGPMMFGLAMRRKRCFT